MKKIAFILLAVAGSLSFINCSKDDDGGRDCFDCNLFVKMQYCYNEGDDYYTISFLGQHEEVSLDGATWGEVKSGLQEACNMGL